MYGILRGVDFHTSVTFPRAISVCLEVHQCMGTMLSITEAGSAKILPSKLCRHTA